MLKYRLIFGILMIVIFLGLMFADSYIDGSLYDGLQPALDVNATIFTVLILLMVIPAQLELKKLLTKTGTEIFLPITIPATMIIVFIWYLCQFQKFKFAFIATPLQWLTAILITAFWAIFLRQAQKHKTENVISNISTNIFTITYLGFFSVFVLAIRIDFGIWPLLMYIFTIKFTDVGAYFTGKKFGKTPFSPAISPKKSWEGMLGGIFFSVITASLFAYFTHIMHVWLAIIFGIFMAFLGQLSDLAESMIKRDARQKDSSAAVPGFGGILDVIDSLLLASPLAYTFFHFFAGR